VSTPPTLDLPPGVACATVATARGEFAVLHTAGGAGASDGGGDPGDVRRPARRLVLVPGWTGSKEDFIVLLPRLADHGWHAVAYDQRGQHETPGPDDADYSLKGLAADARAVADAVADDHEPVDLLGHSLGGLVAQQALLATPHRWRSLTLLCSGPAAFSDPAKRALLRATIEAIRQRPLDEVYEEKLRHDASRSRGPQPPPEIREFLRRRFLRNSPASLAAMTAHLVDAPDLVDRVAALTLPRHVVYGEDDDGWPRTVQDEMARRLGVPAHRIPNAGHSPNAENPTATADLLARLLAG
jgi:pimeloyl-ACP methyl ester carboxylesterase